MNKLENIGEWKQGKHLATVVSDVKINHSFFKDDPDEDKYYGGHLVCESVPNPDLSNLISAAPDMHKALNLVVEAFKKSGYYLPVTVMDAVNDAIFKAEGITKVDFEEE